MSAFCGTIRPSLRKDKQTMTYQVTIKTDNSVYGKTVEGYDGVLALVTNPEVTSYIVYKGEKQVTFAELASAWRHPARQRKYPPLKLPS